MAGFARVSGALLLALALGTASAGAAAESGGQPPKLVQLSYSESDDGSSPKRALYAFARRAEKVRFVTRYDGERATARSRYVSSITDTDLNGEARHPWALIRRNGGKQVLGLIHEALFASGSAKVMVVARGNGRKRERKVKILLAECTPDPPLYPVSCEVKP